jgi:hypothetical protein
VDIFKTGLILIAGTQQIKEYLAHKAGKLGKETRKDTKRKEEQKKKTEGNMNIHIRTKLKETN